MGSKRPTRSAATNRPRSSTGTSLRTKILRRRPTTTQRTRGGCVDSPKAENIKKRQSETRTDDPDSEPADVKNNGKNVEATTSAAKEDGKPVEEDPTKVPEPESTKVGSGAKNAEAEGESPEDPRSTNPAEGRDPPVAGTVLSFPTRFCQSIARI